MPRLLIMALLNPPQAKLTCNVKAMIQIQVHQVWKASAVETMATRLVNLPQKRQGIPKTLPRHISCPGRLHIPGEYLFNVSGIS
jgi:hypothetical protein